MDKVIKKINRKNSIKERGIGGRIFRVVIATALSFILVTTAIPVAAGGMGTMGTTGTTGTSGTDAAVGTVDISGVIDTAIIAIKTGSIWDTGGILIAEAATKAVKIKFNANGGKTSVKSVKYKKGAKIKNLPYPTREGYDFLGWYTKKSGGKKIINGTKVNFRGNITLYAHWDQIKVSERIRWFLGKTFAKTEKKEGTLTYIKTAGGKFGKLLPVNAKAPLYQGEANYYEFGSSGARAAVGDKCAAVYTTTGALFPLAKNEITCQKLAKHIGGTYKGPEVESKNKKGAVYCHYFKYKKYGIKIKYYSTEKERYTIPSGGAVCVIYKY